MQGFLLSALIVISFIVYAFFQKFGGEQPNIPDATPTPIVSSVTPTTTPAKTVFIPTSTPVPAKSNNKYKDGTFTGDLVDANYGNVQVKAIISNGKITDVQFLDYPHDRSTSQRINSQAMPMLTSEAIVAQSANVDVISGATFTSEGFIKSLQSALNKAANS